MKLIAILAVLVTANTFPFLSDFLQWKQDFGKEYESAKEELTRMLIFLDNWAYIKKFNAAGTSKMKLGLNEFADMTHEEFKAKLIGNKMSTQQWKDALNGASKFVPLLGYTAPDSVDWREKGAVTPIKNQGQCGSCYSFSTTGSIEGQWFLKKGKLVSLSEQQILDCSQSYGNTPCNGGLMTNSFRYIISAGGLETEADYPYEAQGGYCMFEQSQVAAKISQYQVVGQSEALLQKASASIGPISVGIDASQRSFQLYQSGVYDEPECDPENIDHAVLVVGYGVESDGTEYWLVKNSWGTTWGDEGYVKMVRNKNNQCGIANLASYPIV